jgi:hypothetical protein
LCRAVDGVVASLFEILATARTKQTVQIVTPEAKAEQKQREVKATEFRLNLLAEQKLQGLTIQKNW